MVMTISLLKITQTGDDTTIGVKLKKDLNVTTVTATDTVKAGGVTMGKHADTKNYVTVNLENKDWDVNKSNPVSGRCYRSIEENQRCN